MFCDRDNRNVEHECTYAWKPWCCQGQDYCEYKTKVEHVVLFGGGGERKVALIILLYVRREVVSCALGLASRWKIRPELLEARQGPSHAVPFPAKQEARPSIFGR